VAGVVTAESAQHGDPSATRRFRAVRRPGPLAAIAVAYLSLASGIMIWRGISVSPDYLVLMMVPVALVSGRFLRFVGDWVPFVAIFMGWEAMRGIAPKTGFAPHVADLANAETWLFGGHLPTAVLQDWLHRGGATELIDDAATIAYFGHFAFPLIVGMLLWIVDRTQFLRFTTALLAMAFAAFVVFLLVPTAPPWYAQDHGAVSGFTRILGTTLPSAVSPYYNSLNANQVAAFPSLHAAFPFLGYLALRPVFPRGAWIALMWCVAVWFSVVYLGEHYVIDVVAGVAFAMVSWIVLMRVAVPRVAMLRGAQTAPAAATGTLRTLEPSREPTTVA
jgi:membrane-associated phospholipid phosphatase